MRAKQEVIAQIAANKLFIDQCERAKSARSSDGLQLLSFIHHVRRKTADHRANADPEDVRWNTTLWGQIVLLDRIIEEWENPYEKMKVAEMEDERLKKELDALINREKVRKERGKR
jgi:hypothetical protein